MQKHLRLMWVSHKDAKPEQDQLQGEEEEHLLPHQNALEDQTRMTIQQPASLRETAGTGGAGGQKGE